MVQQEAETVYVGFWARVLASVVDSVLILAIAFPVLYAVYGGDYFTTPDLETGFTDVLVNKVFPVVAVLAFWIYRQATPGKMLVSAKIVDAKTGEKPSVSQYIIRYLGYIVSTLPLGLGLFWVAWDKRKQGWHDKMAGTLVVKEKA